MVKNVVCFAFLIAFIICDLIFAQSDFKISGEFRVRSELDGRDFLNKTYPQSFTALRVRLNFEKAINEHVMFFAQIQDSRVFGEERNTLKDLKNIDLHQGFLKVKNIFDTPFFMTLGRFTLEYGGFKIFGPNSWHNVGRSHDGFIIGYNTQKYKTDFFITTHSNFLSYRAGAAKIYENYDYNEAPADTGFNIFGFYSTNKLSPYFNSELYSFYEWNRLRPNGKDMQLGRYTLGTAFEIAPSSSPFNLRFEFTYQGGKIFISELKEISAFLILVNLQYKTKSLVASLNADINSGGDPKKTEKYKLFDNPYSTKHNYQGFMDFFTALSDKKFSTGIYGLNDYFIRVIYTPWNYFNFQFDGHYFTTFVPFENSKGEKIHKYGPELNLLLRYKLYEVIEFEWGLGLYFAQEAMKELYNQLPQRAGVDKFDPAFWTYVQINVKI
ncbi:MAG: alginate export family protein [Candidatus Kapaibacteriota bacterium]